MPAIAAGNTVVLKHAESVTGSAMAVEDVFQEAFGAGVLRTIVVDGPTASDIIEDSRVAAVTFTGSDRVGALVASRAGAALKKCVLELGGSDPFVVLADADVPAAAAAAVKSRSPESAQGAWFAPSIVEVDGNDSVLPTDETFGPLGALTTGPTMKSSSPWRTPRATG
ncbi:aldehyde dehydrogenase family protein [Stenotrophomonas sp. NPDC087984]